MSGSLLDFVHAFSVEDRTESDHMPVELYCNFYTDQNAHLDEQIQVKKEKIIWCEEKVQALLCPPICVSFSKLTNPLELSDLRTPTSQLFSDSL